LRTKPRLRQATRQILGNARRTFAGQDKLAREDLIAKAKQLGLDAARFAKDLDSHRFKSIVNADRQEANRLGGRHSVLFH
jgi:predicted DsbA family dithiol-disulfide isomerase